MVCTESGGQGVEGHSRQRNTSVHKVSVQERIPNLGNDKELGIFERVGQEMEQGAGWIPYHEECPLSYKKWASWAQGRFFTFKRARFSPWRNGWALQVWSMKYAR